MSKISCCLMSRATICPAVYDGFDRAWSCHRQCRARHRYHRLPGPRLLLARDRALDPDRAGHLRAVRRRRAGARTIGALKINISGCINACGHHHVGHIGILGLERKGAETYQLSLGGSADETCSIGSITGRAFLPRRSSMRSRRSSILIRLRSSTDEDFLATYRRVGMGPFKEALYGHE